MPHVVCEPCIGCKHMDCVLVCPVPGTCFHEGPDMLYINPAKCIDCEACVPKCPVDAIFLDENVPEKWSNYVELNKSMAPKCPSVSEKPGK